MAATRQPPITSRPPPGDEPDEARQALTFQWGEVERRWPSLFKWLLLTFIGMVGFSYVFKVTYPQYQVTVTAPRQVTVLNAADPATAPILQRIAGTVLIIMPDSGSQTDLPLEPYMPFFHPSIQNHEFHLQDASHAPSPVPPARLLDPTAPVLPAMDLSQLKRTPAFSGPANAAKPTLQIQFEGPLAKRKITHLPSFASLALADPEAWKLHVGVDPRGRVAFALPVTTGALASRLPEVVALLQEMHFEAQPTPEDAPPNAEPLTWDNVTFQWRPTATP